MEMCKFNSGDKYIYYCGKESLRRNGIPLIVNKESKIQCLGTISKMAKFLGLFTKFNSTVIQVYVPLTNAKEAEVE